MIIRGYLKKVLLLAIMFALFHLAQPSYYQAKAELAQWLLDKAWQKSQQDTQNNFKPWPWADTSPRLKLSLVKYAADQQAAKIQDEYIVLTDASGESLAFGPGLMTPNILPGQKGNSFIAAHRDTHFASLQDIQLNDELLVEGRDKKVHRFVIDQIKIVNSEQEQPIIESSTARLTLVTCYPFDMSVQRTSLRLLVSGRLIDSQV